MLKYRELKNSVTGCLNHSLLVKTFKQVTVEFCSNSSIHGIRYVVEPGRKLFERVFWAFLVIISLMASLLIAFRSDNLSMYYIKDYIKSLHYPTYMAPQPAFTFCYSNFQRSRAQKLVNLMTLPPHYDNATAVIEDLKLLHLLIDSNDVSIEDLDLNKLEQLQQLLNDNSLSVEAAIRQLIQPCLELFVFCNFGTTKVSCAKVISSSKADCGFCCSLNYIPPPDENNHKSEYQTFQDKLFVKNYGFDSGNGFLLNLSVHDQLIQTYPASGVEIHVHGRVQYPRLFSVGTFISNGWESFVRLTISMRQSAPEIRFMEPRRRSCYFEDEIKLKYFTYYSYGNCISEARMDFIIAKCGCLPVTFPNQAQLCSSISLDSLVLCIE